MGWVIIKDKKEPDKVTVSFPEEKKEAVFYNGKLSAVTVDGVKVLYPDGVHPMPTATNAKDDVPVSEAASKKAIKAADAFVDRIDNNSVVFYERYPERFGEAMIDGVSTRSATRVADLELEIQERKGRMDNAIAMREAKKKLARTSPELATILGDEKDYAATMRKEENRISAAYGVASNAQKPDGRLSEADLKKIYEAELKRLEAVTQAKNRAIMMSGKYRSTR